MKLARDAVVVGAGIVGAACAEALSSDGLSVTVIEPNLVGGGATAEGMGHLVVLDDSEDEFALSNYSVDIWNRLRPALPASVGFSNYGTVWVAADEEEFAEVRRKHSFATAHGLAAEILDAHALAEAEPNLRPGLAGGLLVPGDSVVYAPCAAQWLLGRASDRGADVRMGVSVTGLEPGGVRLSNGSSVAAGVVVLAAGTAAPELLPGLPVTPKKGHLAITDRYPGFVRRQLMEMGYMKSAHGAAAESVACNVQPRPTGQMLIGSSRQMNDPSREVDHAMLGEMLRRAVRYVPGLAGLSIIRVWTGHRAATPDGLPLIGPWPEVKGVFVAAGHEGLGITTSLGTARLIADTIAGRETGIPLEPYLPSRFGGEHG
jgi:glycine/D-amino acid oxidase-like deaminating enzyme